MNAKNFLFVALLTAILCGCATSTWVVSSKTDEFTDITTKTVSMNLNGGMYDYFKLAFFASSRTNQIFLGVRSMSGIPVGTVQLRIDQNPAIELSPLETPVFLAPSMPKMPNLPNMPTNFPTFNTSQMLAAASPFTATTGDKANEILKQMIHGKILGYRTIGINQAASTTGEVPIDASFIVGLKAIGIDPANY